MAKINPNAASLIKNYIENLPEFSKNICELLYNLIYTADTNVIEDWKWNIPVFHDSYMTSGFAAFKKHVSLTFFEGAIMSDKYKLFSEDCSAQKTRTIKYSDISEIDNDKLLSYFKEAFGMDTVKKPTKAIKKELIIPYLLQKALSNNQLAKQNFENMAYTYKKEYANHIAEAKRENTKLNRLKKVMANLELNIKMHEKYKC